LTSRYLQIVVDADVLLGDLAALVEYLDVGDEFLGLAIGVVACVEPVDAHLVALVLVGAEEQAFLDLVVRGPGLDHRLALDDIDEGGEAGGFAIEDAGQEHEEAEVEDKAAGLADELVVPGQLPTPAPVQRATPREDAVAQRDVHQAGGEQQRPGLVDREQS